MTRISYLRVWSRTREKAEWLSGSRRPTIPHDDHDDDAGCSGSGSQVPIRKPVSETGRLVKREKNTSVAEMMADPKIV